MADFTKQHVQNLFAQLKLLNVHAFRINFEGSGDDGQIDEIEFYNANENINIPNDMISWVYTEYGQEPKDAKVTIHKAIEDLGYKMLDETGHDWYNNDGGYGTIDVTLEDEEGRPSVHMEMNIRYTSEDQYDYDDNNFSMFAEGEHIKTEERQRLDMMKAEWVEQRAKENMENA